MSSWQNAARFAAGPCRCTWRIEHQRVAAVGAQLVEDAADGVAAGLIEHFAQPARLAAGRQRGAGRVQGQRIGAVRSQAVEVPAIGVALRLGLHLDADIAGMAACPGGGRLRVQLQISEDQQMVGGGGRCTGRQCASVFQEPPQAFVLRVVDLSPHHGHLIAAPHVIQTPAGRRPRRVLPRRATLGRR